MSVALAPVRLLGRVVLGGVRWLGDVTILLGATLVRLLSGRFDKREALRQAFEAGNRSVAFVVATMSFIGMIMVLQACFQAQRLVGDFSIVGPGFLQLLVREFAPTIGAMMIATRVGAGIAAELGSMAVTEQLDALRIFRAEPVTELVAPRSAACAIMVPALLLIGGFASELAGLLTARISFGVPYDVFLSLRLVSWGDLVVGLTKAFAFGWVIPVISARAGLAARGGSAGVGHATTRAVIDTSLAIIIIDFILNLVMYPLYQRGA
ncbi:ABC transporter permease [Myxococcota bacterium]|nr:ABC transporter permease [Myxococcota bacterium]